MLLKKTFITAYVMLIATINRCINAKLMSISIRCAYICNNGLIKLHSQFDASKILLKKYNSGRDNQLFVIHINIDICTPIISYITQLHGELSVYKHVMALKLHRLKACNIRTRIPRSPPSQTLDLVV